jgi:hypothetical protein
MPNYKDAFLNDATSADRPAVVAAALVLTAVAGLLLLWGTDREERLSRQIGAEMSDARDVVRVQTLLRAF